MCTTSWFDLHTSGNKFNEHPSSHIDTKLKDNRIKLRDENV